MYLSIIILFFADAKEKKKDPDKLVISSPLNFEHTLHVGFDPDTGEFTVSRTILNSIILRKQNRDFFNENITVKNYKISQCLNPKNGNPEL